MKQPSVYSRSGIVDAAYELIRERGWSSVSTRSIAKKLGSSTMPIYSHVNSAGDLERELQGRAHRALLEYQNRAYTEEPLLNAAFGYVAFARDEPNVFRFLFAERQGAPAASGSPSEILSQMRETFVEQFGEESPAAVALTHMPAAAQEELVRYTWVFTHGLATLVSSGTLGSISDDQILSYLQRAGFAFYLAATYGETPENTNHRKGDL